MKLLIINGPNLNMLGIREPGIYGSGTYEDLCKMIQGKADNMGVSVEFYQSNHEGAIIDKIHSSMGVFDGIVINPGAYTHYSYAILDALKAVGIPTVEVHISDIHSRESFRSVSVTAAACIAQISGHGFEGYCEAIDVLESKLR
ncbi:MAG: type II 3-dehydroquinate dehydratase [Ruminococcaceae bacterium]|nr:type II 3-dehydroquinate dehydratase [Oscillospiraceae bacterium]